MVDLHHMKRLLLPLNAKQGVKMEQLPANLPKHMLGVPIPQIIVSHQATLITTFSPRASLKNSGSTATLTMLKTSPSQKGVL
jgi:hypothetical protein